MGLLFGLLVLVGIIMFIIAFVGVLIDMKNEEYGIPDEKKQ